MSLTEADRPAEATDDAVLPHPQHDATDDAAGSGEDQAAPPIYAEVVAERGDPTDQSA